MDPDLTARRRAVIKLVATGMSNRDIGARLGISVGTVKVHLHKIYQRCGVRNRTALTAWWKTRQHRGGERHRAHRG